MYGKAAPYRISLLLVFSVHVMFTENPPKRETIICYGGFFLVINEPFLFSWGSSAKLLDAFV